jgi:hypothetical protein
MTDDEKDRDEGDLGGIGERSGSVYRGEDGMGSIPHMPVEEAPAPEPDPIEERPPLEDR